MGAAAQSERAVEATGEPRARPLLPGQSQDRELIGTDTTNLTAQWASAAKRYLRGIGFT